jgi:cytochrome c oxidase subunit 2
MYPPNPVTDQGKDIWSLYNLFFVIAAVIFVGVEGVIVWSILRYRRRGDQLPRQTHGNNVLEVVWTAIPTALVLGLFVISFGIQGRVDARVPDPPVTVDVTGFQWQWTFEYKDHGLSYTGLGDQGPVMWLPVGETVHIRLHSNNVIHSFYVPAFLFKRDVIPGQVNNFDLKIDQAGTYSGQCAQLCGMDHYQMVFSVKAVPPAEFQAWLQAEEIKARATPTPAASGAAGTTLQLGASNTQSFDKSALDAAANQPFSVQLTNSTPSAPHNFAIKDASGKVLFTGMPLAQPNQSVTYSVPALPAGTYTFFCSVHPNMTGTLTVK